MKAVELPRRCWSARAARHGGTPGVVACRRSVRHGMGALGWKRRRPEEPRLRIVRPVRESVDSFGCSWPLRARRTLGRGRGRANRFVHLWGGSRRLAGAVTQALHSAARDVPRVDRSSRTDVLCEERRRVRRFDRLRRRPPRREVRLWRREYVAAVGIALPSEAR